MTGIENNDALYLKAIKLMKSTAEGSEEQLRQMLEDCTKVTANTANTAMTGIENNDALYLKGIKLMNSTAEGSEEQLRQMLEDCIRQRYGNTRTLNLPRKDSSTKKESTMKASSNTGSGRKDDGKKDLEKRSIDKSCEEILDTVHETTSSRKSDLTVCSVIKSSSPGPSSPHSLVMNMMRDVDAAKEEVIPDDDDDLALEILEEDLMCVICRGMDVGVRNQLVECLECHSLYHQECHQPPVPDDMNEPRSAWYCTDCTKALNKIPSKFSSRSSPKPNLSIRDRDAIPTVPKQSVKHESTLPLFKRTDKVGNTFPGTSNSKAISTKSSHVSASGKSSSTSGSKVFGGASLSLKNLGVGASISSMSKSTSSSNASKGLVPKINIVSADKRLAIMKKKAAKLQEKRKLTK